MWEPRALIPQRYINWNWLNFLPLLGVVGSGFVIRRKKLNLAACVPLFTKKYLKSILSSRFALCPRFYPEENGQMLSDEGIEIPGAVQVLAVGRLRRFGKPGSFQECSAALGTAI